MAKTIAIVIADETEADAVIELMKGGGEEPLSRVALRIVAALVTVPGECIVCGCTEDEPCVTRSGDYDTACSWVNSECTICSRCLGIVAL